MTMPLVWIGCHDEVHKHTNSLLDAEEDVRDVVMDLIQSARLNGHVPYAYLKDVLTGRPTQPQSRIGELLPHRWRPESA
jgi:hypothetical protein